MLEKLPSSHEEAFAMGAQFLAGCLIRGGVPPRDMAEALDDATAEKIGFCFFAVITAFFGGIVWAIRAALRRPRKCKNCHEPRLKLDNEAEKEHMTDGQISEERVGSIVYDVWWCARCRDAEVVAKKRFFTRYKPCPGCGHKTSLTTEGRTITWATTYSGGLVEMNETCEHCDHKNTYTRATPMLADTSSSSSDSSYSSSSSSSSDSGGSSSGDGSSGSW